MKSTIRKKIIFAILIILIMLPLFIYGGWKVIEYQTLSKLKGNHFSVEPYAKDITTTEYDVIVVGGEPEGVAAAVSAARNGATTLLIEKRDGLGGLMTYGMLNFIDYDEDMNGDIANAGIFKEWHDLVGREVVFDIETAKDAFLYLVQQEPNLTLSLHTELIDVRMSGDQSRVEAVLVEDETGEHTYTAKRFIDTTQNADLAHLANVPYFIGGADIGQKERKMAVTLMIHLKNVRWEGVAYAALTKKFGEAKLDAVAAWGFIDLHHMYKPTEPNTRLRGLNIARQSDKSIYINALHIFDVDGLDPDSIKEGIERGKRETEHVVEYLREEFPGFKHAEIASFPNELYVRETRHILAEYQLPITDLWEQKDHWDSIGFGSYPVDIQATSIHDYGYIVTDPIQYAIPFRSLVPLEIDGLLVASKASGYSSLAAGSARIIPTGMTTAQAAGAAAALAVEHNVSFREMSKNRDLIEGLQEKLKEQGALLYPYTLDYPYEGEWYYPAIEALLNDGLVSGNHNNDLNVDKLMSELEFVNLITNGAQRSNRSFYEEKIQGFKDIYLMAHKDHTPITKDRMAGFILTIFGHTREGNTWQRAVDLGYIDSFAANEFENHTELSRKEGYYMTAYLIEQLQEE